VKVLGIMDVAQLQLTESVAAALAALGWSVEDPRVREAAPTAARGHNLAVVAPPSAAYGAPALAGLISRAARRELPGPALLLCPETELDEWGLLAGTLVASTDLRVELARGETRAAKHLQGGTIDLLIASPRVIAPLAARGTLKGERVGAIVLAGPERWLDAELLVSLMPDIPQDRQRIVLASAPERAADLVERYARKALVLGAPADVPAHMLGPVRTVAVGWQQRVTAVGEVLELLDPQSLTVWTADRTRHAAIAATLPGARDSIQIVTGDAPQAEIVIAFDPPDPPRLGQLLQAGQVVLLVPPGSEPYVERIASPRRPLRLAGPLEAAVDSVARRRGAIARRIDGGRLEQALLTLAPLFDRHDATAVAAAVYDLWVEAASVTAAPPVAPVIPDAQPVTTKVFVGVGKIDGATPNDLVAVLTKEVRVAREKIGRIELRDAYSLVELPAQEAERIASALNGVTIRRKRVVARIDRGRARPVSRAPGQRR
jgi:ATP-dependent RNA helicase DeaD